jgi:hypothetical protein
MRALVTRAGEVDAMPDRMTHPHRAASASLRGLPLVLFGFVALLQVAALAAEPAGTGADAVLFDFEDASDLEAWTNLELPGDGEPEPPVKLERVSAHATSGDQSLKLTFGGGRWPTITTTRVGEDWLSYQTFLADVTAARTCVIGFTVLQEQSKRGDGYDPSATRWTRTQFLRPGRNRVSAPLRPGVGDTLHPKRGKVVRFEIFLYNPRAGESLYVDNIRLTTRNEPRPPARVAFAVAATDLIVEGVSPFGVSSAEAVIELGKKLKGQWTSPEARTLAQLEDEFQAQYLALQKEHPRAILAVLRDGEKGYDPAAPEKVFAGWRDAYFTSHGPDGNYVRRARNEGKAPTHEVFMRHRTPLMRVDLSRIPSGATILAARLIIVRAAPINEKRDPRKNPTMWVVEPCSRPWEEYEVNAYEYARDRFWNEVGGYAWGEGADFLPMFLAYGPSQGMVNWWDFTEAVRFWTDGKHVNHGFMLHGDAHDVMIAHSREATEIKDRPAVLVIYEPRSP